MEPERDQGDSTLNRVARPSWLHHGVARARVVLASIAVAAAATALAVAPGCSESGTPAPAAAAPVDLPLDAAAIAELDRGVGQLGMFDFTAAEATFAAVLQARPRLYEARLNHAISVLNQTGEGTQQRAIELLDGILRDRPGDFRAEYCQALGYLFLGDPVHALPRFRRAAEHDAADPYAQFYAGQCSELQGEMDAARRFYARAAEMDPYLRSALLGLQRVAARPGDEAAASRALETFKRLADNPRSHLAEFKYTRMGSLGEAVLPASAPRSPVRPTGPILAPLASMPIDGVPPAPAVVHAITPAADLDGDGSLDFVAQVEYPEEMRIERRIVRSVPGGRWRMEPGSIDTFRRGRQFWGDFDNDGRVDVAFGRVDSATRIIGGGVWVGWAHQEPDGRWQPFTFQGATQPADDLQLCADLDHDGDLDFLFTCPLGSGVLWNLGRPSAREPIEWERRPMAGSLAEARAAAADLDGDGDLDLLLWSATGAAAQAWKNDRLWAWSRDASLAAFESSGPGAVVPFRRNEDGESAIATLVDGEPGSQHAMQLWERDGAAWKPGPRTPFNAAGSLWVTDLSGSGHANIVVRDGDALAVMDAHGGVVERIPGVPDNAELAVLDARGPVLVSAAGADGVRWMGPGSGRSPYAAIAFRGRTDPSQQMRTNASGIGTRMDARIGGEWVACDALPWRGGGTQALEPVLVGLGDAARVDFVAVRWPDAVTQTELGLAAGTHTVTETQRQISSCPVIFAWDGARHRFVTDCLGVGGIGYLAGVERSADGSLRAVYPPPRPWERVMLGGADALAPTGGCYEVRLGEPMEEACYLDAARLAAWDIPAGWQMTLDERMAIGGPAATGEACFFRDAVRPVRATVARGTRTAIDQTAAVHDRDGTAADLGPADPRFIGRLAEEAVVTLEFGTPLALHAGTPAILLDGWVEYPYSSTGFAMWQARAPYQAPSIEAQDPADGSWKVVTAECGYPAGMPRRCVLPLPAASLPAGCTAIRLRTTMEIYVDALQVAWFEPCPQARRTVVPLATAAVADAGFAARIPHPQRRPDYDYARRVPLWDCRTQVGAYTAFGDCTPLLAATDDAVAIFGAGEEVRLRFDAARAPAAVPGSERCWVLEVDGWCKDMDLLTGEGAELGPLPLRDGRATTAERDALHARFNVRWAGGR